MRDQFSQHLKHIRKEHASLPYTGFIEEVRKVFFTHLDYLPEEMLYDIFNYLLDTYADSEDAYADFDRLSEKMLDTADLLGGVYDDETSSLTDEDIDFIKESANDFALDLDDKVLFYIMEKAVERGSFKHP